MTNPFINADITRLILGRLGLFDLHQMRMVCKYFSRMLSARENVIAYGMIPAPDVGFRNIYSGVVEPGVGAVLQLYYTNSDMFIDVTGSRAYPADMLAQSEGGSTRIARICLGTQSRLSLDLHRAYYILGYYNASITTHILRYDDTDLFSAIASRLRMDTGRGPQMSFRVLGPRVFAYITTSEYATALMCFIDRTVHYAMGDTFESLETSLLFDSICPSNGDMYRYVRLQRAIAEGYSDDRLADIIARYTWDGYHVIPIDILPAIRYLIANGYRSHVSCKIAMNYLPLSEFIEHHIMSGRQRFPVTATMTCALEENVMYLYMCGYLAATWVDVMRVGSMMRSEMIVRAVIAAKKISPSTLTRYMYVNVWLMDTLKKIEGHHASSRSAPQYPLCMMRGTDSVLPTICSSISHYVGYANYMIECGHQPPPLSMTPPYRLITLLRITGYISRIDARDLLSRVRYIVDTELYVYMESVLNIYDLFCAQKSATTLVGISDAMAILNCS